MIGDVVESKGVRLGFAFSLRVAQFFLVAPFGQPLKVVCKLLILQGRSVGMADGWDDTAPVPFLHSGLLKPSKLLNLKYKYILYIYK
jgi:hypothetical protein